MPSVARVSRFVLAAAVVVAAAAAVAPSHARAAGGGGLGDCCYGTGVVDLALEEGLGRTLDRLRETKYLSVFRVDLESECELWQDDAMCARRACSVCECEEDEIPAPWRVETTAFVDKTLASDLREWTEEDDENVWVVRQNPQRMSFVDMRRNPESYTAYEGDAPHRIWSAIYNENCFASGPSLDSMCVERRLFYRLVSGLHSCISAHIAWHFPAGRALNETAAATDPRGPQYHYDPMEECHEQAPSREVFDFKLGRHPDRVENLYYALVLVMRAVRKASPALLAHVDRAADAGLLEAGGDARELVRELVEQLVRDPAVAGCEPGQSFDETGLFAGPGQDGLLREFKHKFRNISRILSCVGCERCMLHGKLQVLGLGTALKVLLTPGSAPPALERTEVVALVHTLGKLVHAARVVRWMGGSTPCGAGAGAGTGAGVGGDGGGIFGLATAAATAAAVLAAVVPLLLRCWCQRAASARGALEHRRR